MMRTLVTVAMGVFFFGDAALAQQLLMLNDGRRLEGKVVRQSPAGIVFRTKVGAIEAELDMKMSDVVLLKDLPKFPGPVIGSATCRPVASRRDELSFELRLSPPSPLLQTFRFLEIQDVGGKVLLSELAADSSKPVSLTCAIAAEKVQPGESTAAKQPAPPESAVRKTVQGIVIFTSTDGKNARQYKILQGSPEGFAMDIASPTERLLLVDVTPDRGLPLTDAQQQSLAALEASRVERERKEAAESEKRRREEAQARADREEAEHRRLDNEAKKRAEDERRKASEAEKKAADAKQQEQRQAAEVAAKTAERKRLLATGKEEDTVSSFKLLAQCLETVHGTSPFVDISSFDVQKTTSLVSPYQGVLQGNYHDSSIRCLWTVKFTIQDGDWHADKIECCNGGITLVEAVLDLDRLKCGCK